MAWKGTRPPAVTDRDERVYNYLQEHGSSSRNTIADALSLPRSLTYLSLYRLRDAGRAKRCVSEQTNELMWTVETDRPCP
jgi:predicted transcriptional regulator